MRYESARGMLSEYCVLFIYVTRYTHQFTSDLLPYPSNTENDIFIVSYLFCLDIFHDICSHTRLVARLNLDRPVTYAY